MQEGQTKMTKFKEIYIKREELKTLKYKRELLNMRLSLSILNNEESKQIQSIKEEIKRLTKIIGDRYLDIQERMQLQIKDTISIILSKNVTEENAYTNAQEIEEYIINQDYKITEKEFKNELIILYETYNKLGYIPQNTEKDFSTIKQDTLQTNKKDYINQVLYNIQEEPKEEEMPMLKILKDEIINKQKEKAINKVRIKQIKLV